MRLSDKRIVITGAGSGIGRACARRAAAEGARVALVGRRAAALEETARDWPEDAAEPLEIPCDVGLEGAVSACFDAVAAEWGGVDGLVTAAAVFRGASFAELPLDDWEEVLRTNLTGVFLCCREAVRRMGPGGAIVNVGSLSGIPGVQKFPGFAAYNVSKYGVLALTEIVALEGGARGIRCHGVAPGAVDTAMLAAAAPGLPPAMSPEAVARAVVFLLSDEGAPAHGSTLVLNGDPAGKGGGES